MNITDLNDSGQVVGTSIHINTYSSFVWSNGTSYQIPELKAYGTGFQAKSINNQGLIAGFWATPNTSTVTRAGLWNGSKLLELETTAIKYAYAISQNNSGTTVGTVSVLKGTLVQDVAARWDGTTLVVLGDVEGGQTGSLATAVNDSGVVVGWGYDDVGRVATLWSPSGTATMRLGHCESQSNWSYANDINAFGQVVGVSTGDCGVGASGFLYSGGVMTELKTPGTYASAVAINDQGLVVGTDDFGAVIWGSGHQYRALADLVRKDDGHPSDLVLDEAIDINESGQILVRGHCTRGGCTENYFLLSPVPELPATAMLLAGGVIVLTRTRRRW